MLVYYTMILRSIWCSNVLWQVTKWDRPDQGQTARQRPPSAGLLLFFGHESGREGTSGQQSVM